MKTYRNKRTNSIVERHECVLVVIDVQEKLMPVIADKENVLSNIIRLIKACHLTEIPIVVTEQEKLGNTVAEIKNEFSTETAIQKTHFNCFSRKDFGDQVNNR